MAKPKPKSPDPATPNTSQGRRHPRGPIGPTVPEVSVFAAFKDAAMAATPADMAFRGRKIGVLVTDDPSCIGRFSHAELVEVGERPPRLALLETHFTMMRKPIEERVVIVAGSAALVEAALDDAWRVVAQVAADEPPPYGIAEWRMSRPKDATTTTYSRD